jgi:hypothetical protein
MLTGIYIGLPAPALDSGGHPGENCRSDSGPEPGVAAALLVPGDGRAGPARRDGGRPMRPGEGRRR